MISDLDEHVGAVVGLLDALDLSKRTLVIFSSDNGPTHDVGGVDTNFFDSAGPLRGRKGSVYEGGLRVPMIARWPGKISAGSQSDHVSGFQDLLPTMAALTGQPVPDGVDGVSYLPTLLGKSGQEQHDHLVWEFFGYRGQQAVRAGRWKAVRQNLHRGNTAVELYDLDNDLAEARDVSNQHPEIVKRLTAVMERVRVPSKDFPIKMLDG